MSLPIRFALVGCGRIGKRHAQIIAEQHQLTAVCDTDTDALNAVSNTFGARRFSDFQDLLTHAANFDVVVIATPNGLHYRQAIEALQAGCHVLCEKPMCFTKMEADAMLATAQQAQKQLWVVKQNRFNPPVQAVKNLLNTQSLGKILSVQLNCYWNRPPAYYANSWKGTLDLDGGTLYTQFSHFIDLLVWFFGPLEPLAAALANLHHHGIIEFEDTGMVIGRFADGTLVNIHYTVNSFEQNMEGSITIFGEKGTVKIGGQYLNELDYQMIAGGKIEGLPPGNPPNEYDTYRGSMSNHPQVYENLANALQFGAPMINTAVEAALTVDAIEKIYKMGRVQQVD